jgi:hypothetical protein
MEPEGAAVLQCADVLIMLNIQRWLRENVVFTVADPMGILGLKRLETDFGVYSKQHPDHPNLYQFAYDQIEAKDKANPIVRESRGLILDSADLWSVVAYPFNRFANYGETWADEIDWTTARVQEKVDGSLCILYNYLGTWRVATRGSANAAGQVGDNPITFRDLFWTTWCKMGFDENYLHPACTYMFELTSPMNRVVVHHKEDRLTLLGVRNNFFPYTEYSLSLCLAHYEKFNPVQEFSLGSFGDCLKAAENLDPIQTEGYVVVDGNFNRVKIKSPSYVALHHIRDAWGPRRVIELIKAGETEEVLTYFPEYIEQFRKLQSAFNNLIFEHETGYEEVMLKLRQEKGHNFTQKDFALLAKKYTCPAALFCYRNGKANTIREFFLNMAEDKILEILK